ncbi:hypothetical protein SAMN05880582_101988 [Rhizobium sp. RU20A]|uniref:hypothetical protein n=1 Tax=Rhizobium sp. RU20A TaxID=1907412 RepID=UPI0009569FAF|nr:hypothetical protein [Rhizobium sp. RU20A]SIQ17047.1 hypothetical protein SAMN05880582_101988 [Rhizobium sp. RU20A]
MKRRLVAPLLLALVSAGCTATNGPGLEPIPGSITYNGQPRTKLTKSPIGSIVPHQFFDDRGRRVQETYVIEPDRSLKLVNRRVQPEFFPEF